MESESRANISRRRRAEKSGACNFVISRAKCACPTGACERTRAQVLIERVRHAWTTVLFVETVNINYRRATVRNRNRRVAQTRARTTGSADHLSQLSSKM